VLEGALDGLAAVVRVGDDVDAGVSGEHRIDELDEELFVVGDEDADRLLEGLWSGGHLSLITQKSAARLRAVEAADARERIQKLLVTGDNRLKQGVSAAKARQSYEQALEVAREAGLEDSVRPLVEVRLADLERLARGSPPPSPPAD
jgi:hypothetical protein